MGSEDLRLPEELRQPLFRHLQTLKEAYQKRGWGGRVGFGETPALIVIDLGRRWIDKNYPMGSDLESVVEHSCQVLEAAREAAIPIFFTTWGFDAGDAICPADLKNPTTREYGQRGSEATELDPRLRRRPAEKLIVKKYASAFKGTDLQEMLTALKVDTLIVTGCSTSHCVYATCRDAVSSFRVIVPGEAVGDRCELFHLVSLLDIELGLGDVMPTQEVVARLRHLRAAQRANKLAQQA